MNSKNPKEDCVESPTGRQTRSESSDEVRVQLYQAVLDELHAVLEHEPDWIAAMSTVCAILHERFEHYHWIGFYRHIETQILVIGPYQGSQACLRIPFARGVCGYAARHRTTVRLDDVHQFEDHIACSPTTRSEIVLPLITGDNQLVGVLDIDSDWPAAFSHIDQHYLERICASLVETYHWPSADKGLVKP